MSKDYTHLEGKEITWKYDKDDTDPYKAIVVLIDEDIGITLVNAKNKDHRLTCLHGPSVKDGIRCHDEDKYYKDCFDATVQMIKEGVYIVEKFLDVQEKASGWRQGSFGAMSSCSFA